MNEVLSTLWFRCRLLVIICLVIAVIHVVNTVLGGSLSIYGILPRNTESLLHIFTAPFIHGSWQHLINNLVGLSIFSSILLLHSTRLYLLSSLFIIVVTGLLVWLFARSALHIGASGWIFGLWSLCIAMAWYEKNLVNIVISLSVISFYGGMAFGVLPTNPCVSFESHLFGAISGIMAAGVSTKISKGLQRGHQRS